jgi:predicted metal-dependent peptidase
MKLERLIYQLLQSEPYYAHFVLNCDVRYQSEADKEKQNYVPTAAAGVQNGAPVLIFNTTFMNSMDEIQQQAILKHEVLHLVFDHADWEYYDRLNLQVWNVAMDCAINQYIHNLPSQAITLKQVSELAKTPLKPFESAAYYYNALYQVAEKMPMPLDAHGAIEGSELDKKISRGVVAKASEAAVKSAAGQLPNGLAATLDKLKGKSEINWQAQLRNFVASAISSKHKQTRTKAHRRFELDQPGKRKERKLKLAVCLDSSGSVNDEQFASFLVELKSIIKNCAEANVIYADCEVQKVINLKQNADIPLERYGNGGTAYQPALSKAQNLGANVIIFMGDMDSSDTPENPGIPVMWLITGKQDPPASFGRVLRIK